MELSFFTALKYNQPRTSYFSFFLESFDDYFYLGGKKAYVIQSPLENKKEQAVLSEARSSILALAGKVLSYFTVILPLIALIVKAILRSIQSYELIDPKFKLEEGIHIPESTLSKIKELMPKIQKAEDDKELHWLGKGNNHVFKVAETPNLVFKLSSQGKFGNDRRFANMIKAKEVCLINKLGLLLIPRAKKFDVEIDQKKWTLIAEETLDLTPNTSAQEELYEKCSEQLNETARQLATFIAKTGFSDVNWRNIPILNETSKVSDRHIGLIDLEHLESVESGFSGSHRWNRGLIRCVSEKQIDLVIEEARKNGISISDSVKSTRLEELKSNQKLEQYYKNKNIVTGKEPLKVNIHSLGLDLNQEEKIHKLAKTESITLKEVAEVVISEINKSIQNSPDIASVKGKRRVVLKTDKDPLFLYRNLGSPSKAFISQEEEKNYWIYLILQALVDKGHLFKVEKDSDYIIQA